VQRAGTRDKSLLSDETEERLAAHVQARCRRQTGHPHLWSNT
jgi:hypothetical protein